MTELTELYRHFDSSGRLLYVGISLSTAYRLSQHQRDAVWFKDIVNVKIERYPTRKAALKAERNAIESEHPIHNKIYNSGRSACDLDEAEGDSEWLDLFARRLGVRPVFDLAWLVVWVRHNEEGRPVDVFVEDAEQRMRQGLMPRRPKEGVYLSDPIGASYRTWQEGTDSDRLELMKETALDLIAQGVPAVNVFKAFSQATAFARLARQSYPMCRAISKSLTGRALDWLQ